MKAMNSKRNEMIRSARWAAPGASQIISSIGNSLLAFAAASSMTGGNFGKFILCYGGVLLVSQIFRVAIGESSLLSVSVEDNRFSVSQRILCSAVFLAPILGLAGVFLTWKVSGDLNMAVATGVSVFAVSLCEVGRYTLLVREEVRGAIKLDMSWVILEIGSLMIGGSSVMSSPTLLLWCWAVSAVISISPVVISVQLLSPRNILQSFRGNRHWWRLAFSEALTTLSAFFLLSCLAKVSGVEAVGEVRAALLPFQWVHLVIASAWLIVLSRKPSPSTLRKLLALLLGIVFVLIGSVVATIEFVPLTIGKWILNENWHPVEQLAFWAGAVYILQATAEVTVLRLKATYSSLLVLRVRLISSVVTGFGSIGLWFWSTREVAFLVMMFSQGVTALAGYWFLRYRVIARVKEEL